MLKVVSKVNAASEREFNRALSDYMKVSRRSMQEILNNKAYYTAVGAVNLTHKADKEHIARDLGKPITIQYTTKRGKVRRKRTVSFTNANRTAKGAPLVALIINARRGRKGKPGLQGAAMTKAIRALLGGRSRSVNFLRASWLPAVKQLSSLVKKSGPRPDNSVQQRGKPKGGCQPATITGNTVKASIWSSITKNAPVVRQVLEHGLSKALRQEAASMMDYVRRKLAEDTRKFS
jgi:hypothetical protein